MTDEEISAAVPVCPQIMLQNTFFCVCVPNIVIAVPQRMWKIVKSR